ncbi:relaxase/mobilization nuclease domain-containing protein [Rhodoplanes sp. SY1]|uniref:relaxase/mobilization nuclease domain-containing protein n=1 Tax=Rhodoplanes sp. SY1 TaxID=3166646 RepID=UPI0038B526B2
MIVKFNRAGKSFKGLAAYLTHDAGRAQSSERVAWTHTLNLANDEVPLAVDEMLWTCRAAQDLKREAGVSAGGRRLENPVKHFSLNWHPDDKPEKHEMIEAVEDFVRHLGWEDRQAILIAHSDRQHAHVHVMLNTVSPVDGRAIDTAFEHVRASNWALSYERSRFRIHCEQRLKPYEEREPSPTRDAWQAMKDAEAQHDRDESDRLTRIPEYFERGDPDLRKAKEWSLLKTHQRKEREAFFAEGKQVFRSARNAVFREVRTDYRNEWMTYYDSMRRGLDPESLDEMKVDLVARQKADLEARREVACKELRERRDREYKEILRHQKEERAELRLRQEEGLASPHLLDLVYPRTERTRPEIPREDMESLFRLAGRETCSPAGEREPTRDAPDRSDGFDQGPNDSHKVHDGASASGGLGLGALGGLAEIGERLFDGFFGGGHAPMHPRDTARKTAEVGGKDDERARRTEEQIRAGEAQSEAERLLAWWQERRQRQRDRD